jgi:hypothetical protein
VIWLVATAALAAPPEGLDVDDLDTWEARSADLLDGPDGCWDLSGTLQIHVAAYTPPSLWTRAERHDYTFSGEFDGRISDGDWSRFEYTLKSDGDKDKTELDIPIYPLMGRIDQEVVKRRVTEGEETPNRVGVDAGGDAMNLLDQVLEEIDPAATIAYAQWDDDKGGVTLLQDMPLTEARNSDVVTLTTFVPGGGAYATSLDAEFPRRIKVGDGLVKATVFDAQLHLRAQQDETGALPQLESVSLGIGVLGFTAAYEQKLVYAHAATCTAPPAPAVEPVSEP